MRTLLLLVVPLLTLFPALASAQPVFEQCLSNGAAINGTAPIVETITVPTLTTVNDVQVSFDITHTFVGDVDLALAAPNGSSITLHDNGGGGDNDINVIFGQIGVPYNSEAFTCGCVMQPQSGNMLDLVAGNTAGDWVLTADDDFPSQDNGTLDMWCLALYEDTPPVPVQGLFCFSSPGTGFADVTWNNPIAYDEVNIYIGGLLVDTLPGGTAQYTTGIFPTPSQITVGVEGVSGGSVTPTIECTITLPEAGATVGADVTYQDCTSITQFTNSGPIRAYALGSHTCNRGPENMTWGSTSPLLGMNAYKLEDGRLLQIGLSFVKNGTIAAAGNGGCGTCNGSGGSVLGSGCRDIYGSGFNGGQGILGPRSTVNAFTGAYPGASGPSGQTTDKRLQIAEGDLMSPMADYFVEGVYVAFEDAASGNAHNNASYKPANVNPVSLDMSPTGTMAEGIPAIQAWADHGLGLGIPDSTVEVFPVDVPSEGRFHVAMKVTDLGGGQWLYDYAVFNLNSHRSGGSFSVPLSGASATNAGFHDVDYHSGEPYDLTDWDVTVTADAITWSSPETFATNPNSNALRWGTMYNFWFESDTGPGMVDATLGLFRPGTPDSISFEVQGPEGGPPQIEILRGDMNNDGNVVALTDGLFLLTWAFNGGAEPPCLEAADFDDSGMVEPLGDALRVLNFNFTGGPPPNAPFPACGVDPGATDLGCLDSICP